MIPAFSFLNIPSEIRRSFNGINLWLPWERIWWAEICFWYGKTNNQVIKDNHKMCRKFKQNTWKNLRLEGGCVVKRKKEKTSWASSTCINSATLKGKKGQENIKSENICQHYIIKLISLWRTGRLQHLKQRKHTLTIMPCFFSQFFCFLLATNCNTCCYFGSCFILQQWHSVTGVWFLKPLDKCIFKIAAW